MATILSMMRKFKELNTDLVVYQAMKEVETDFEDLNKEQLYDGKTKLGTDIRPSYFEDPYFETYQDAAAYSDWKDKITPNIRRNPGTPNLYINGYYYESRKVVVLPDVILHTTTWGEGDEIADKYKNINGLGGSYKRIFLKDYLMPVLSDKMFEKLGLRMRKN
jgi:hypothetical protein